MPGLKPYSADDNTHRALVKALFPVDAADSVSTNGMAMTASTIIKQLSAVICSAVAKRRRLRIPGFLDADGATV